MHQRSIILSSLIIAAVVASALVLQPRTTNVPWMTASAAIPVAAPITTTDSIIEKTSSPVSPKPRDLSPAVPAVEAKQAEPSTTTTVSVQTATLVVGSVRYTFGVSADETVADAMRALAASSDFRFTSREYPGMGIFIESINGTKETRDASWFLYINGKSADTGASQTTVHPHDVIEWKLEQQ